jgi:hypothetical protein
MRKSFSPDFSDRVKEPPPYEELLAVTGVPGPAKIHAPTVTIRSRAFANRRVRATLRRFNIRQGSGFPLAAGMRLFWVGARL